MTEPTSARPPAAVLWDFDGTLVMTEPLWIVAQSAISEHYGGTWNDTHGEEWVGADILLTTKHMVAEQLIPVDDPHALADEITDDVTRIIREREIEFCPGVLELLADLQHHGVRCALVSASPRRVLDAVLDRIDENPFEVIVSGENVANAKPHPEPYLRAAAELGVPIEACVALEDSPPGVASAAASGALVLAVPTVATIDEVPGSIRVLPDLVGLTWAGICARAAQERPHG